MSQNDREIAKNIERANNHIERLGLDIHKSLMFAEEEYFGVFVESYKKRLQTMIKEQTATISDKMIKFLTVCDEASSEIEECITKARQAECTAKDIITKEKTYEKAYQEICDKIKKVKEQCPVKVEKCQTVNQLSRTIKNDIDDKTTTLREICEFYWKYIKNDISWREIKQNEFDVNSLLSLVETLDYVAWYAINGKGLGNAKKNLQELHIEIRRSLLRRAEKDFSSVVDTVISLSSAEKRFLNIKNNFYHIKQDIQNEINRIDADNLYNSVLTRLTDCYEKICKANKACLLTYREYKNEKALHNIDFPIL
jgi:hypothetical protein